MTEQGNDKEERCLNVFFACRILTGVAHRIRNRGEAL